MGSGFHRRYVAIWRSSSIGCPGVTCSLELRKPGGYVGEGPKSEGKTTASTCGATRAPAVLAIRRSTATKQRPHRKEAKWSPPDFQLPPERRTAQ